MTDKLLYDFGSEETKTFAWASQRPQTLKWENPGEIMQISDKYCHAKYSISTDNKIRSEQFLKKIFNRFMLSF